MFYISGLPDTAASVGHARAEVLNAGGLVEASQSPLVILIRIVNIINFEDICSALTFPP